MPNPIDPTDPVLSAARAAMIELMIGAEAIALQTGRGVKLQDFAEATAKKLCEAGVMGRFLFYCLVLLGEHGELPQAKVGPE